MMHHLLRRVKPERMMRRLRVLCTEASKGPGPSLPAAFGAGLLGGGFGGLVGLGGGAVRAPHLRLPPADLGPSDPALDPRP